MRPGLNEIAPLNSLRVICFHKCLGFIYSQQVFGSSGRQGIILFSKAKNEAIQTTLLD